MKGEKRIISREEVSKHNTDNDAWLIYQDGVYDVSKWGKTHPGGSVIYHYKGQDATDTIDAFHPEMNKVENILKHYKVGELSEDEKIIKSEDGKTDKVIIEFRELKKQLEDEGYFRPNPTFYILHLLQIVALEIFAMYCYVTTNSILLTAIILSISQIQAGWLQHDFGHNAVFKTMRGNELAHYITIGVLKGALSGWWKSRHNRHHSKTNVIKLDPDIHVEPLFSFSEEMVESLPPPRSQRNISPSSSSPSSSPSPSSSSPPSSVGSEAASASASSGVRVRYDRKLRHSRGFVKILKYQHYYWFAFGPPLVTTLLFLLENAIFTVTRASKEDFFAVLMYFLRFDLTYRCLLGMPVHHVIILYFTMRFLESHWFTWVTSMNHLPRPKSTEMPSDWVRLQLLATQNVSMGFFYDWFTGHLNYQIEHHLFPKMPRHNYPLVAARVKSLCERNGIEYKVTSMSYSCFEIVDKLRQVSVIYAKKYGK